VHRLFYGATIDEAIRELLEVKRELFESVIVASGSDTEDAMRSLLDRTLSYGYPQFIDGDTAEDQFDER
jgi:hypothetical protein